MKVIKLLKHLKTFRGLPYRVEYIGKKVNNIYFYNDSKATNVFVTSSALQKALIKFF